MSDLLDLPTLIIIGVAVFVLFRLRSVLGTRTGNERKPSDRIRSPGESKTEDTSAEDKIVPLRPNQPNAPIAPNMDGERRQRKVEAEIEKLVADNEDLAKGLMDIAEVDVNFTPNSFLEGAKSAYEMIVTAYAEGDRRALKNLLEKEVYDGFDAAISEREAQGHTVDFTFVGLPSIEFSEATLDKRVANVSLRFKAEIVSATNDASGTLVEGDAEKVMTISDEWTFARQTKSRDPNWKLVATDQLD